MRPNHHFLLDSWNLSQREVGGFSAVRRQGSWELEDAPACPGCARRVWLRAPRHPFAIEFPGERVGDIAYGLGATPIVSERFAETWRQKDLLGLLFSSGAVDFKKKRGSLVEPDPPIFYAAYPEPELVCLSPEAGTELGAISDCSMCCSSEVLALRKVRFMAGQALPDFFMPSCLSGWFAISERAAALIEANGFTNFRFVKSFRWTRERRLIREYTNPAMIRKSGGS